MTETKNASEKMDSISKEEKYTERLDSLLAIQKDSSLSYQRFLHENPQVMQEREYKLEVYVVEELQAKELYTYYALVAMNKGHGFAENIDLEVVKDILATHQCSKESICDLVQKLSPVAAIQENAALYSEKVFKNVQKMLENQLTVNMDNVTSEAVPSKKELERLNYLLKTEGKTAIEKAYRKAFLDWKHPVDRNDKNDLAMRADFAIHGMVLAGKYTDQKIASISVKLSPFKESIRTSKEFIKGIKRRANFKKDQRWYQKKHSSECTR
ncbi:MAG: hypothetical protein H6Q70_74 [Firmicutes bacterium]|nr:hypothetical protein [Bacillota bacterium]